MLGFKVISLLALVTMMLIGCNASPMTTRELIIRIKFCQAKTCNKCAKMVKTKTISKNRKVIFTDCNKHSDQRVANSDLKLLCLRYVECCSRCRNAANTSHTNHTISFNNIHPVLNFY